MQCSNDELLLVKRRDYTINGRFSNVPSVTRTFTSININIASGDGFILHGNILLDSKCDVLTVSFVTKWSSSNNV